jgi:hypothetical protein
VLIACEGEKTEREYFLALRRELRLTSVIVLAPHIATDPRSLVEQAREELRRRTAEKSWHEDSSSWAVYDGDEHILHNPQNCFLSQIS